MWLSRNYYLMVFCLFVFRCTNQPVDVDGSTGSNKIQSKNDRTLQAAVLQITSIQIVDVTTGSAVLNINIADAEVIINLATLTSTSLTVITKTSNDVASVKFGLNSNENYRTESSEPYAMCGNIGTDLVECAWLGIVGTHILTVTPYSNDGANGIAGATQQLMLSIVNKETCKVPKFVTEAWESVTPAYPISVAEPQGLLVGNDLVIFSGFVKGLTNVVNQTYAKDVTISGSPWRRMEDVPIPIGITHTPTVRIGKKVVMCGGYLGGVPGPHVANCFIYDHNVAPGMDQWTKLPLLPDGGSAGAGMIYDSETRTIFYVSGSKRPKVGDRFSVDVNTVWKYTFAPGEKKWVASTPIPFKSNHMSSVTHLDTVTNKERHFFLGGQIGENEHTGNLPDMYELIVSSETWVRRASMPMGRGHAMASTRSIGCGFIIASGSVNTVTAIKNRTADISYYDIPTNRWTSIGNLVYGMVTPIIDIDTTGYIHHVDTRARYFRRRISV